MGTRANDPYPKMETGTIVDASKLKSKGYGFIKPCDGFPNVYFHVNGEGNKDAKGLSKGQTVSFFRDCNRKGPCAICVKVRSDKAELLENWSTKEQDLTDDQVSDQEEPEGWLHDVETRGLLQSIIDGAKSVASRQRIRQHRAASMLYSGAAASASDRDAMKHVAASEQFQASQLERQRTTLESNMRRQPSDQVVSAHEKALKAMLSFRGKLTVAFLCEVHAILCEGLDSKEPGKLRSVNVRAGTERCCKPEHVLKRLEACLALANRWLQSFERPCAEVVSSVIYLRLIEIHPFRDGNGRIARMVCNWILQQCGVPFVICLFSTPDQRQRYVASHKRLFKASRQLAQSKHRLKVSAGAPRDMLAQLTLEAEAMAPMEAALLQCVGLVYSHTERAWVELERVREQLVSEASDKSVAEAVRKARRAQVSAETLQHRVFVQTRARREHS